ncbi:methylated-DNA--[protein]-cysteine S-methyltransferase [Frankia sp. AiPs1]|uniref:methylated-DNA--[protein]-cysteine S-methyltransferase n=1 Tax=Frankia sp. AiPs1 TaxID=573493 RepID=UPI0020448D90|nr:methylated-DNA--[protein]-cysteine S-methyltransferase [Frankia sp. AiPs1]MCM3922317.1 methylated-DNA--[protein]-cysteine S-methyltransferase [Frankia sp. AiPs1]
MLYTTLASPVGELLLVGAATDQAPGGFVLTSLSMPGQRGATVPAPHWRRAPELAAAAGEIEEYFAGDRRAFTLALRTGGTGFQERVWRALEEIPYGTTITYGQLAARIGAGSGEVRAVGTAVGANPLLLVRPCHRVIGADGTLRGFAAGLARKEFLLRHEGALAPILDLADEATAR